MSEQPLNIPYISFLFKSPAIPLLHSTLKGESYILWKLANYPLIFMLEMWLKIPISFTTIECPDPNKFSTIMLYITAIVFINWIRKTIVEHSTDSLNSPLHPVNLSSGDKWCSLTRAQLEFSQHTEMLPLILQFYRLFLNFEFLYCHHLKVHVVVTELQVVQVAHIKWQNNYAQLKENSFGKKNYRKWKGVNNDCWLLLDWHSP